jgi:hypothetical protein
MRIQFDQHFFIISMTIKGKQTKREGFQEEKASNP